MDLVVSEIKLSGYSWDCKVVIANGSFVRLHKLPVALTKVLWMAVSFCGLNTKLKKLKGSMLSYIGASG